MKSLKHLNKYFLRYKGLLFWGFLFVILSNIFAVLPARLIRYGIDLIADSATVYSLMAGFPAQVKVGESLATNTLVFLLVIFAVIQLRGFFLFLMRQTIIVMSRHIEYDLKNEVFQHYQQLDTSFYKTHSTGDLMSRMAEDVARVRMFTGPAIMYLINLVALISLSLFYMLKKDVELTVYVLAPLPILAVTIYYVNSIINKRSERIQALLANLTTNAQESYSGIRVIKSFVQEK